MLEIENQKIFTHLRCFSSEVDYSDLWPQCTVHAQPQLLLEVAPSNVRMRGCESNAPGIWNPAHFPWRENLDGESADTGAWNDTRVIERDSIH